MEMFHLDDKGQECKRLRIHGVTQLLMPMCSKILFHCLCPFFDFYLFIFLLCLFFICIIDFDPLRTISVPSLCGEEGPKDCSGTFKINNGLNNEEFKNKTV